MDAAKIHYFDNATMFLEIKDGRIVQFANLNDKSEASPNSDFPKSCRLALVFDPLGEVEPAATITADKNGFTITMNKGVQ